EGHEGVAEVGGFDAAEGRSVERGAVKDCRGVAQATHETTDAVAIQGVDVDGGHVVVDNGALHLHVFLEIFTVLIGVGVAGQYFVDSDEPKQQKDGHSREVRNEKAFQSHISVCRG